MILKLSKIVHFLQICANSARNLRKEKRKLDKWPHFFFIQFLSSNCLWYFCIRKLSKFSFMGPSFRPFRSAKYLNFGGVSCEIRILSRLFPVAYTLRKVKNQVLLFLSSWEPNLSDLMVYFCQLQNAILHNVEASFEIFSPFFSECSFHCDIFSLLLVICLSWNLHVKLSHEFLTFISFNIWR